MADIIAVLRNNLLDLLQPLCLGRGFICDEWRSLRNYDSLRIYCEERVVVGWEIRTNKRVIAHVQFDTDYITVLPGVLRKNGVAMTPTLTQAKSFELANPELAELVCRRVMELVDNYSKISVNTIEWLRWRHNHELRMGD